MGPSLEKVEELLKYVVVIAPGFLVIAICDYLIEWPALEPHIYIPAAVVFSLLVYATTACLIKSVRYCYYKLWHSGEDVPPEVLRLPLFILVTIVVSLGVGIAFSILYVHDSFVSVVKVFDRSFENVGFVSKRDVLPFIVSKVGSHNADQIDGRLKSTKPKRAMLRFSLDDAAFVEGYPMYFPRNNDGFVYLSLACFVTSPTEGKEAATATATTILLKSESKKRSGVPPEDAKAIVRPIEGPGILVRIKDADTVEIVDYDNSRCRKEHQKLAASN